MNQLPFPLFVSDIDGTLISSTKSIPHANHKSIAEFRRQGGLFTLATGRSFPEAKRFIHAFDIQLPVILCNGGVLYHPQRDQLTPVATIQQEIVLKTIAQLQQMLPAIDIFVYTLDRIYSTKLHLATQTALETDFEMEDLPLHFLPSFTELPSVPWVKICVVTENRWMKRLHQWASATPDVLEMVQSSDNFFEILPAGVSKGAAIEKLTKRLGLPSRSAAVIGDHMNDLSMVKIAGTSAAVANAHPSLLQAATHITRSNDEAGVSHFIDNHLLTPTVKAVGGQ
ncbi:HAD family hydrolase [Marininema halotolerans]|uniref:Cof subfamily of IIB subfamily of haloacid dehalogenase superfamily/HAD-superfamily hydrolase, subfamily IIB n=1 Tax=Marininema halotolerans TaxID=1155944 RepID=A0A1I6T1I1_9BACL|nr:HAD family hydrolase [Marininema halotolerans]SFS82887.1 hypothetical protein SAMN05444972_108189 [Marininema halotolerans]